MSTEIETFDSFNWWQLLGIILSLLILALSPYVVYILKLVLA